MTVPYEQPDPDGDWIPVGRLDLNLWWSFGRFHGEHLIAERNVVDYDPEFVFKGRAVKRMTPTQAGTRHGLTYWTRAATEDDDR